jgi:hypothetical protein
MKLFIQYILIILLSASLFVSCKKKEEKILGNWGYVYLSSDDANKIQTWTFNEDNSVISAVDTLKPDTGTWSIDKDFLDGKSLVISNMNTKFDGSYDILTLNKKNLIIQRFLLSNGVSGGAFLRAEFIKK